MARILVIDDEPAVRRTICQILQRGGHEPLEAADGIDGLQMVRAERPDAVITDIMMPNKEGIETICDLRRDNPGLPILVISGNSGSALYLQMATLLGAHAALAKPFRATQLLDAINTLLRPPEPPA